MLNYRVLILTKDCIFTKKQNMRSSSFILLLFLLFLFTSQWIFSQNDPYITVWETSDPSVYGTIPEVRPGFIGDFTYDWVKLDENMQPTSESGSGMSHSNDPITFNSVGFYEISAYPDDTNGKPFNRIVASNTTSNLLEIRQWGDIKWSSFEEAYLSCSDLNISATDIPDLSIVQSMKSAFSLSGIGLVPNMNDWDVSNVKDMESMFYKATNFNTPIGDWDTHSVTNMGYLFYGASSFNQNLNNWDVGNVVSMFGTFQKAEAFNQPLDNWNVGKVTTMRFMFSEASQFNQFIGSWNTSAVKDVYEMFADATSFNQPIGNWDVSSIDNLQGFFKNAESFNQPLENWDVSQVTIFEKMFEGALSFDQPLNNWDVGNAVNFKSMFFNAESFNQILDNWDVSNATEMASIFHGASSYDQPLYSWNLASSTQFKMPPNYSCANYSRALLEWSQHEKTGIYINASNMMYSSDPLIVWARKHLVDNLDWTITSDMQVPYSQTCELTFDKAPFVSVWNTGFLGTSLNHQINLPVEGNYTYEWEELDQMGNPLGNTGTGEGTDAQTIDFPEEGIYRISIWPEGSYGFKSLTFNNSGDKNKIIDIEQWGDVIWSTYENAFYGAENLKITATDLPFFEKNFSMKNAFAETTMESIGQIENWNTVRVINLDGVFKNNPNFNQDIGQWNTKKVKYMKDTFLNTSSFNFPLDDWKLNNLVGELTLSNSGMDCNNLSLTLFRWANSEDAPHNIELEADNLSYSQESVVHNALNDLVEERNWTVSGLTEGSCQESILRPFITVWETGIESSSNNIIKFYLEGEYHFEWFEIDDSGSPINENSGRGFGQNMISLTLPSSGKYELQLYPVGETPLNYFANINFAGMSPESWIELKQWGDVQWKSFDNSFKNIKESLQITATDFPDISEVTSMSQMFRGAEIESFPFLEQWDVSQIKDMSGMFHSTDNFNSPLNNWDVSNVENMSNMFYNALKFNQPLDHWNIGKVNNMEGFLHNAVSFNQSLEEWTLSDEVSLITLKNSGLDCKTYSRLLYAWAHNPNTPKNVSLYSGNLLYSLDLSIVKAREYLENELNWRIFEDFARNDCRHPFTSFISMWKSDETGETANNQIKIPAVGQFSYSYREMSEEGEYLEVSGTGNAVGETVIDFPHPGIYEVKILPEGEEPFHQIQFANQGDKNKIIKITNWGTVKWSSFSQAFEGTQNLEIIAHTPPILEEVTQMDKAFRNSGVSSIPSAGSWDTHKVLNMDSMFENALDFDGEIGLWQVKQVENMTNILKNANSFSQNLQNWKLKALENGTISFENTAMSCKTYSKMLYYWSLNEDLPSNINIIASGLSYSNQQEILNARQTLENNFGWNFNEDIESSCLVDLNEPFIIQLNFEYYLNMNVFTFPAQGDYSFFWEEIGNPNNNLSGMASDIHNFSFPNNGLYRLEITPIGQNPFNRLTVDEYDISQNAMYAIVDVLQWGDVQWQSFEGAFAKTARLEKISATDIPNLKQVQNFSRAFQYSGIKTINNISQWDISSATNLSSMFESAFKFNSNISGWDVSNVTDMNKLFNSANMFNHNINQWDVSNVTDMSDLFHSATRYNQPLNNWDVSNVTDMNSMFAYSVNFNQKLDNWDVSQVKDMSYIFNQAGKFDQNIGMWNLVEPELFQIGIGNSGMSCTNISLSLYGWANNPNIVQNVYLTADYAQHSWDEEITAAIDYLADIKNWSISNLVAGDCVDVLQEPLVTNWNTNPGPGENDQNLMRIIPIITIPASGEYRYYWEEIGRPDHFGQGSAVDFLTLEFDLPGKYKVKLYPKGETPLHKLDLSQVNPLQLSEVEQWGVVKWSSFENMFQGAQNLIITADDLPVLENVTSMAYAFANTNMEEISLLEEWDLSFVTDISFMFMDAKNFNQDISSWDVNAVENMEGLFEGAENFNQSLANWNLSNLTGSIAFGSGFECQNYSLTLQGWAENPQLPTQITLIADDLQYSNEVIEIRDYLIQTLGWEIEGDSEGNCTLSNNPVDKKEITIYPNPTRSGLYIDGMKEASHQVQVLDAYGKVLWQTRLDSDQPYIDLSRFSSGIYFIVVSDEKDGYTYKKVIKL